MSFIIRSCFPFYFNGNQIPYAQVSKKNDDFGVCEAYQWQLANPTPDTSVTMSLDKTGQLARRIIKDLVKRVPLTTTTLEIIKNHLVKIAETSDVLRQQLIKALSREFGENPDIIPIKNKLVMT